ncbi:MAG: sulfatase-like hydrolase/transferase [Gammaproteobacteria bacterium]|nr:sulfatase-like hydrolase/transferase [Gammaproteobacteria bacterium]
MSDLFKDVFRQVSKSAVPAIFVLGMTGLYLDADAYEADAAQRALAAERYAQWSQEDKSIGERLQDLAKKHGQPNILFILGDDIGWGELGSYGGGKLRGTPTPNLDKLAEDGMRFLQHYSEPSCTVTRVALMTGRLPVRTGVDNVLFPGNPKGLVRDEKTIAEVLSEAGYATAMFGKWHLGESAEHQPTNQGFDYALYGMYNGGVWPWLENLEYFNKENETIGEIPYTLDMPGDYEDQFNITIHGVQESYKGGTPREIGKLTLERYNRHDNELTDKLLDFIEDNHKAGKPFFAYFATNAQQVFACPPEERHAKYVDSANCQAAQIFQHDKNVKRLREKLEQLEIAENTLVVWASDNGPMYSFYPSAGFSYLRGRKHEVQEGGVRTPAIAWWPGMIAPGSEPLDLVHVTDWFTTIAGIAGAQANIPGDRIIDGVNQTSLLINGEGYSRRNYLFHYKYSVFGTGLGTRLEAVRWNDIKLYPNKMEVFNIMRDPNEMHSDRRQYLWVIEPLRQLMSNHLKMMEKFPNRKLEF